MRINSENCREFAVVCSRNRDCAACKNSYGRTLLILANQILYTVDPVNIPYIVENYCDLFS